ncbi:MAG TPA: M28 family metallopeptidase [Armatimonadota bacterium]|nr:M28 family metallopeptidase [Armatimonadota bacterium]
MSKMRTYAVGVLVILIFFTLGYGGASWILMRLGLPVENGNRGASINKPERPLPADVEDVVTQIDKQRLMAHVYELAGRIGVRKSGTAAEDEAANYIANSLRCWGYMVRIQRVDIEGKAVTQNIIASRSTRDVGQVMLIGAHIDSKPPSPGANDNASGMAVMLELAYLLKDIDLAVPCIFVGFGAEEMVDRNKDHHHYGSRALAGDESFRSSIYYMTSLDMVGVGNILYLETRGHNTEWRDSLAAIAQQKKYPIQVGRGKAWSDHEAFEKYGIPAAYIHWEKDTHYHKKTDTPDRIDPTVLVKTTELMVRALLQMTDSGGVTDLSVSGEVENHDQ